MAVSHNFRSAMGGFKREDVVRYIEYMNTKHAEEIAALTEEQQALASAAADKERLLRQMRLTAFLNSRQSSDLNCREKICFCIFCTSAGRDLCGQFC